MEIIQKKPSEIVQYERNNKKHPAKQVERLAKQIKEHGFDVPIVIDENNVIIKGHARLLACKKLKMKTIPCIVRTDLSDEQKRAARIADNKLGELAEIDIENLKIDMDFLKDINFDVDLTGFDGWDVENEPQSDSEEFTYNPKEKNENQDKKFILKVIFESEDELQMLFDELNTRDYKVTRA